MGASERRSTLELVVLLVAMMTAVGFLADMIPTLGYDMPETMLGALVASVATLGGVAAKGKSNT